MFLRPTHVYSFLFALFFLNAANITSFVNPLIQLLLKWALELLLTILPLDVFDIVASFSKMRQLIVILASLKTTHLCNLTDHTSDCFSLSMKKFASITNVVGVCII